MDETFPDIGAMSDEELRELIDELTSEEREVSYRRRMLHGKIDILRAELVARRQKQVASGETSFADGDLLDKLTEILAVKAAPRIDDEELA